MNSLIYANVSLVKECDQTYGNRFSYIAAAVAASVVVDNEVAPKLT